ncbi:MAG: L-rhamnose mutarotase [Brevinema sp.]
MIRKAFVMSVKKGFEVEYKKRHDEIWDELKDVLKSHGVHDYSIFLNSSTNQLFGVVFIESLEKWDAIAKTEVCQRWWKYMADIMPSNTDNSPISVELEEMFYLK